MAKKSVVRRGAWVLGWVGLLIAITVGGMGRPAPLGAQDEVPPHLGYGVNLRYLENVEPTFAALNFDWIKVYERFGTLPDQRLPYHVLYRIDISRGDRWTWQNSQPYRPDLAQIRADVRQIALQGRGVVDAYEIGNEPNMDWEWMDQPPDPADYVEVLRVAYEEIKAVDSSAIVVSGGLGPVGRVGGACAPAVCSCVSNAGVEYPHHNCSTMDEREYARELFARGAGAYFDAFGYHPTGFAYAPETGLDELPAHDNGNGFAFRGAEAMRALMVEYGLAHKPMWATEFGWLRDPAEDGMSWCHGQPDFVTAEWYDLPAVTQANYLTRAFAYADENWPWMGAMFLWAFDFHNTGADCWPGRYFSVRANDGPGYDVPTPGLSTLAYDALGALEKRPGTFGPQLALTPTRPLSFTADVCAPQSFEAAVVPLNVGYGTLTWEATVARGLTLTPTLPLTTGLQGTPLTVTVDSAGYAPGAHTGSITVSATATEVLDSPQVLPVRLRVRDCAPRLAVRPSQLTFLSDVDRPRTMTATLTPLNVGAHALTWTVVADPGQPLVPTLRPTVGFQGQPVSVAVDPTGLALGTYTARITVTATTTDVLDSPQVVPVRLLVVPQVYKLYLPLLLQPG